MVSKIITSDKTTTMPNCITCGKTASFGLNTDNMKQWCSQCKPENATYLSIQYLCIICKETQASYGITDKREYCTKCKPENAKNLISNLCKECDRIASYGHDNTPEYCSDHAKDGMENLKTRPCFNNCGVNYATKKYDGKLYCVSCLPCDQYDATTKSSGGICEEEDCGKRRTFGLEKGKPRWCAEHGKLHGGNDVSHGNSKCKCGKRAIFGTPNSTERFCSGCKPEGATDMVNKKCDNCNERAPCRETGIRPSEYKDWCMTCYNEKFNEGKRQLSIKEKKFIDALNKKFPYSFSDKSISTITDTKVGGMTAKRVDWMTIINDIAIAIEIDENQHSRYLDEDEQQRILNISNDFALVGKKWILIRINPDNYTPGLKFKGYRGARSAFRGNGLGVKDELNFRIQWLFKTIEDTMNEALPEPNEKNEPLVIKKLFFNGCMIHRPEYEGKTLTPV